MKRKDEKQVSVVTKASEIGEPGPATEVIAESIVQIGEAMRKLEGSRLNRRALIVLLQDVTKLSRGHIENVLDSLGALERIYLKGKKDSRP